MPSSGFWVCTSAAIVRLSFNAAAGRAVPLHLLKIRRRVQLYDGGPPPGIIGSQSCTGACGGAAGAAGAAGTIVTLCGPRIICGPGGGGGGAGASGAGLLIVTAGVA